MIDVKELRRQCETGFLAFYSDTVIELLDIVEDCQNRIGALRLFDWHDLEKFQDERKKLIELLKCSRDKKRQYEADTVCNFYAALAACSDIKTEGEGKG